MLTLKNRKFHILLSLILCLCLVLNCFSISYAAVGTTAVMSLGVSILLACGVISNTSNSSYIQNQAIDLVNYIRNTITNIDSIASTFVSTGRLLIDSSLRAAVVGYFASRVITTVSGKNYFISNNSISYQSLGNYTLSLPQGSYTISNGFPLISQTFDWYDSYAYNDFFTTVNNDYYVMRVYGGSPNYSIKVGYSDKYHSTQCFYDGSQLLIDYTFSDSSTVGQVAMNGLQILLQSVQGNSNPDQYRLEVDILSIQGNVLASTTSPVLYNYNELTSAISNNALSATNEINLQYVPVNGSQSFPVGADLALAPSFVSSPSDLIIGQSVDPDIDLTGVTELLNGIDTNVGLANSGITANNDLINSLSSQTAQGFNGVYERLNGISGQLEDVLGLSGSFPSGVLQNIYNSVSTFFSTVTESIVGFADYLTDFFSSIVSVISGYTLYKNVFSHFLPYQVALFLWFAWETILIILVTKFILTL